MPIGVDYVFQKALNWPIIQARADVVCSIQHHEITGDCCMTTRSGPKASRRDFIVASAGATAGATVPGGPITLAQAQTAAPAAAPPPPSSAAAARAVNDVRDAILRISREVWATPELSLAEVKSSQIHIRELEAAAPQQVQLFGLGRA
jgi:hypothetical protein